MKDFSYLQVFSSKMLREVQMILSKGFTLGDINNFLNDRESAIVKQPRPSRRLPRGARRQLMRETKFGRKRP